MNHDSTCPDCGAAIAADAAEGLCARCVFSEGVGLAAEAAVAGATPALRRFGDYELLEEIARGGMGVVWRARQVSLNRIVALKLLPAGRFADANFLKRFRAEAEATAHLHHAHIVNIHEIGEVAGQHYFSMDYVAGRSLAEIVRDGPVPARQAARWLCLVAGAIAHAHGRGLLHRDLKPGNVLIDENGEPRVTDFGLVKRLDGSGELTAAGQVLGTPNYLPPEQAAPERGESGPGSDVYSMGATLYHLLAGRAPFTGESIPAVLHQVVHSEVIAPRQLNPDVPPDLETICLKCLEKNPARRYRTAQELGDELGRFLKDEPILARPAGLAERARRWCRREPARAALIGSVALLLVAVALVSSLAAWRISRARSAEQAQRAVADTANLKLRASNAGLSAAVNRLEQRHVEDLFNGGDPAGAAALLASIVRRDPSNHVAATRLVAALLEKDFALPAAPALQHLDRVWTARFSAGGKQIVTASADHTAKIWSAPEAALLFTLPHPAGVRDAAFSPDGALVATAGADGGVRLWAAASGRLQTTAVLQGSVTALAFSADGRWLAAVSTKGEVAVWQARDGERVAVLAGHTGLIRTVQFNGDGTSLVTASHDGTASLWKDWPSQRPAVVIRPGGVRNQVLCAQFSPDGEHVVTGSSDFAAKIWNGHTGAHEFDLPTGGLVYSAQYSADGEKLVTASSDGEARIWHARTGRLTKTIKAHSDAVNFAAFSPHGTRVVTAGMDNATRVWDATSGEPLTQPLRQIEQINTAEFSADGRTVLTASADLTAQLWDISPSRASPLKLRPGGIIWQGEFSPDGSNVVLASIRSEARVWNSMTGTQSVNSLAHSNGLFTSRFSPDGARVLTASADRTAAVWSAQTGELLLGPWPHDDLVWSGRWSADGRWIATTTFRDVTQIRDAQTGQPVGPPLTHPSPSPNGKRDARFSPDGQHVLTIGSGRWARLWNIRTGAAAGPLLEHGDQVWDGAFSPDGKIVATACADNGVRLWNPVTGELLPPRIILSRLATAVDFSPDGLSLLTASWDGTARIWRVADGSPLTEPMVHASRVVTARFSRDGRRVVTATQGGVARVWDPASGLPMSGEMLHPGALEFAAFNPDGARILTGGADGVGRIWEVPVVPLAAPAWLPELAEVMAGQRLSDAHDLSLVRWDELSRMRARLLQMPPDDPLVAWARWCLADRRSRPASWR